MNKAPLLENKYRPPGVTYNDKYVIVYEYGRIDQKTASIEVAELLTRVDKAGLESEVRQGRDETLLIFVHVPRELLGNTVHKSRVKDWLFGVIPGPVQGNKRTIAKADFEAEDLLSVFHLINWGPDLGGAGITPRIGQWKNVASIFPLHNPAENRKLLYHLSRNIILKNTDFDHIRDLYGAKVAFYFAFTQTYTMFLTVPAAFGILAWYILPEYSMSFALLTCLWCSVFLEYWKLQERDLSLRWNVNGIGKVKVTRPGFEAEMIDDNDTGERKLYFPTWKRVCRQLAILPILTLLLIILGFLIVLTFGLEVLISDVYTGPYKFYLEYVPTLILALGFPYLQSGCEVLADRFTEWENHRTMDRHDFSRTQKICVFAFVTNYVPIFMVAFVYVPYGHVVLPMLSEYIRSVWGGSQVTKAFVKDPNRLRNEVIALTLTGQLASIAEENVLPFVKRKAREYWHSYRLAHGSEEPILDDAEEAPFLESARAQASLDVYNVQDDYSEMVIQFGYLALFSPVWPLISIGFLINNIIELRTDLLKICVESQRPAPIRTEGIGPWIHSLEFLTWIGSISTAAIVHVYSRNTRFDSFRGRGTWWGLFLTVFVSEHAFILLRAIVRSVLEQFGSPEIQKARDREYSRRKEFLDELEGKEDSLRPLGPEIRATRRSEMRDAFWTKQLTPGSSFRAAEEIMSAAQTHVNGVKPVKGA